MGDDEINRLAASVSSKRSLVEYENAIDGQDPEFQTLCKTFKRAPSVSDIEKYFEPKIQALTKELALVTAHRDKCKLFARSFWQEVGKLQKKKMSEMIGKQKARKRKDSTVRFQKSCPITGCIGRAVNMNRHFAQCHSYLSRGDRNSAMKKWQEQKSAKGNSEEYQTCPPKIKCEKKMCALCDKAVKRIDTHLIRVHKFRRTSLEFRLAFQLCAPQFLPKEVGTSVKVQSGKIDISITDPLKHFLDCFLKYLDTHTPMCHASAVANCRMVKSLLTFEDADVPLNNLNGTEVVRRFKQAASVEPQSFFAFKSAVYSKGYLVKIAKACSFAVEYMSKTELPEHNISETEKNSSMNVLEVVSARYRKGIKGEILQHRTQKARENLPLDVIKSILDSKYMQDIIQNAASCLSDASLRPTTVSDFTMIRDVLITTLAITSMKRLQEFSEFRLSEFLEREALKNKDTGEPDGYVVRVTKHKTA